MENPDKLITLVIHTDDRAAKLKDILEFHGISVTLEDVVIDNMPLQANPKKVRIPVDSLPLGLKILESGDLISSPLSVMKMTGLGSHLLIPVDFSPSSIMAVKVGFFLAEKFGVEPIVMHSFIAPLFPSEPFGEDLDEVYEPQYESEAEEDMDLRKIAAAQLSKFKKQIEKAQADGSVANIKFSTSLLEGIPEQVINDYCKSNHPLMIVMSTRGIHKKESDLIGSVTAEVIDSCRVPVFTVPENYDIASLDRIKSIIFFCTFSGFDVIAMRGLMRAFDYPACNVHLLPVSDRPISNVDRRLDDLAGYFTQIYPTSTFVAEHLGPGKFDDNIRKLLEKKNVQTIIVPNKKSSAFSRFFRPTLAHKILFDKDIPLLVLPV